ncbi:hypothetical protein GCM10008164_54880 [Achromobacter xylosoxidans]|nr:hypothetical protein GCM10008164_54880 [Achromobacter xylosoxidans]
MVQILREDLVGQPAGDKYGDKPAGDGGEQNPEQQHLGDVFKAGKRNIILLQYQKRKWAARGGPSLCTAGPRA